MVIANQQYWIHVIEWLPRLQMSILLIFYCLSLLKTQHYCSAFGMQGFEVPVADMQHNESSMCRDV